MSGSVGTAVRWALQQAWVSLSEAAPDISFPSMGRVRVPLGSLGQGLMGNWGEGKVPCL